MYLISIGASHSIGAEVARLTRALAERGLYGEFLFVLSLALVCIIGIVPASAMAVAAGSIYGVVNGILLSAVGVSLGGIIGFVLARSLFRDLMRSSIDKRLSLRAVDADLATEGWKLVLLLRLSPIAPFGITSYALGLTRLAFTDYLIGTLGSIPALVGYVYIGVVARQALRLENDKSVSWPRLGLLGIGVAATLLAGWHLYKVLRGSELRARLAARAD